MIRWTDEAAEGTPYWWAGRAAPADPVPPPDTCDLLVIGAGYTGLSAAIAAHDAGARVAVVDAGRAGDGASTRNGGMVGAHPRLPWDRLAREFGTDTADALFAEADTALSWVRDLIAREDIDCDFQTTGRLQLAWTDADAAAQAKLANKVRAKSQVRVDTLSRSEIASEITTPRYRGGLLFHDHAALHPRKYHDGMRAACARRAIPIAETCPVTALDRDGPRHVAHTPKGAITADKVVLATNGYTSGAFRRVQARVFPLPSFLIATQALPSDILAHLAPGRRMMVETRAKHSYFRLSPDGSRILFGGRAAMRPIPLATAAARLRETLVDIWPDLAEVRLSHVWTGNTGYSFSHMPAVGQIDGLHHALGYSGSGTVMAPYLGAKAALQAVGDPDGATAYGRTRLRTSWLHPTATPHFLHAADLWYRHWVDRRDHRAAPGPARGGSMES